MEFLQCLDMSSSFTLQNPTKMFSIMAYGICIVTYASLHSVEYGAPFVKTVKHF